MKRPSLFSDDQTFKKVSSLFRIAHVVEPLSFYDEKILAICIFMVGKCWSSFQLQSQLFRRRWRHTVTRKDYTFSNVPKTWPSLWTHIFTFFTQNFFHIFTKSIPPMDNQSSKNARSKNRSNELASLEKRSNAFLIAVDRFLKHPFTWPTF